MQCYIRRNLKYAITFLAIILCEFPTNVHNIAGIQFPFVANILNSIVQNSTSKSVTFVRFQTVSILFHKNLLESREVLPRILPTCNFSKIKWKIQRIVKKMLHGAQKCNLISTSFHLMLEHDTCLQVCYKFNLSCDKMDVFNEERSCDTSLRNVIEWHNIIEQFVNGNEKKNEMRTRLSSPEMFM